MRTGTMLTVATSYAAQTRHANKLWQLAKLAGFSPEQFSQGQLVRGNDVLRQPPTNDQLAAAFELATRLEASLPDHAGTALRARAALCLGLLDPAGGGKLALTLHHAQLVLGIEA